MLRGGSSTSGFLIREHNKRKTPPGIFFFFFAATQLARQVHQERTQVVCSNKSHVQGGCIWITRGNFDFGVLFFSLRVEFLLKTDSGYPKDTGGTLFNPGNHWESPQL